MRKKIIALTISLIVIVGGLVTIFGIFVFSNKPSARYGLGLVYDKSVKKVVLFGGGFQDGISYTMYGDTWSYDPIINLWAEVFPSNSPSARSSHSMVYDSVNEKIILFGGVDLNDDWLSDTWIYDSATNSWTQVFPDAIPPIRGSASMYYDVQAEKVIMYGGYREAGGHLDDTWAYDYTTNNWTNLNPISKPTGRYGAPMVYDSINQRGLMFGGRIVTYLDETWVYYYSNNTWLQLSIPTRPIARYWEGLTYDESAQKVILFGGRNSVGVGEGFDDTWTFDPSIDQWTEVFPSSNPSNRFDLTLVYVPEIEKTISFGGFRFPTNCFDDTWSYDYSTNNWNLLK